MPRLYREAPLNSIWEGSGNVACLDVLRAMVKSPESVEVFLEEIEDTAASDARVADALSALKQELSDFEDAEMRARRIVERMALTLQGALLVRHGHPAAADAFCASRLRGEWGHAFGTLPSGVDARAIIDRHLPATA
jgi:putative acyl-CoA dehydrogenase